MIILMFLWYYEKGVPILALLGRDSPSFIIYLDFKFIFFSLLADQIPWLGPGQHPGTCLILLLQKL